MAFRKNTNLRNLEASTMATAFNSGTLQIYTGSQPASANSAATGTLLATITLPSSAFASASGGSVAKSATAWQTTAAATGTAGWARFTSSSADRRMDCSVAESGADLTIDNEGVEAGGTVTVTGFTFATASGE